MRTTKSNIATTKMFPGRYHLILNFSIKVSCVGVNLDIDGRISLMGRSGAQIYVDGKPGKYSGINGADDLKMLHVSEIEKIELVPDASFEYLDNPQAGIINIITKK